MKRFLGILLVLLVLVFAVPASMSVLASEEDLTITAGEVRIVESIDGEIVFLRFVPGVSGTYNFSADSGMDTVGYLYDENNNLLEEHDDGDTSDCSVTYELCADTVYYWGVKLYSYCTNAPFPVEVVCIDSACTHDNVTQCEMQAATCTSYGYTAGDFCEDCKTWISGREPLNKQHTDENADLICDLCSERVKGKYSGSCGDNLTWDLYDNGTLLISGEGDMWHWNYFSDSAPWIAYSEQIYKVVIREGVTSIGQNAFCSEESSYEEYNNTYTHLREVIIPDTVTAIYTNGLSGLKVLEEISLPSSVTTLVGAAFNNNYALQRYIVDGNNSAYKSVDGVLFSKDGKTLISYPIGCLEAKYTVPQSTETIAAYAFSQCSDALQEICFNEGLTFIDDEAFQNCDGLRKIVLPDSLKTLGGGVFQECSALWEIDLPAGITRVGGRAFRSTAYYNNWDNWVDGVLYVDSCLVETVYAPDFVDYSAWQTKSGTLSVRGGTTLIADESVDSSDVDAVIFNDGLQHIGFCAFGWLGLESIDLPDSLLTLGDWAFYNCEQLSEIKMGSGLQYIGHEAFGKTPYDNAENYVNGILYYGPYVLGFDSNLPDAVVLREGTKLIAERAFWKEDGMLTTPDYGAGMRSITFPESLTTICDGAFYSCNQLKTATIPATVTFIGHQAFGWIKGYDMNLDAETFQKMTDFSIEGYKGTAAEDYAAVNGIPFKALDGCEHEYTSAITTPNTCTTAGVRTYQCKYCEDTYTETVPAQHTSVIIDPAEAAGCITTGKTEGQHCGDCGAVIVEQVSTGSLGHSIRYENGQSADCGSSGLTEGIWCNDCQKYIQEPEIIPPTGAHQEIPFEEIPATCVQEGRTGGTFCGQCGQTIRQPAVVPVNDDHKNVVYDRGYPPTCTVDGKMDGSHCGDCGDVIAIQPVIPSGGHDYATATCTEAKKCTVCGTTSGEALGHTYTNACDKTCNRCTATRAIIHNYAAATCTEAKKCTVCGTTSGKALGHTYTNACDKTCNRCTATRAITHNYAAATCTKAKTCTVCGVTSGKALGHTYTNACDKTCNRCKATRTIKHSYAAATCTKAKKCTVCGVTSGKALGHTYTNACDKTCNRCKANRSITHAYKTTTTKATLTKNGSVVKKCTVCGTTASKSTIKYAKTFKLSVSSYMYDGKVKTPSVTVKDSAGKVLKKNTDYTVTYASGRKNVGTYKVTIKMKGKYSGTKTLTFKINPAKTTVSKLTAGKKSITASISKKTTQVSGYQIQYSTSKSFSKATTKTISSNKTTKYALKNLSAKKTYYVRVRTYKTVGKVKYYSDWSAAKSVKTK